MRIAWGLGIWGCWLLASGAAAQDVYLAFGDSITEGVGDDPGRAEAGYPPRLEQLFQNAGENVSIVNAGLGGERTTEGLTRIDSFLAEGGDFLILMEGTNDVGGGLSVETIRFNLSEMARKAEAQGFSVILATTIPRLPNARRDPNNLATQELNQEIRNLAGTRQDRLADPFEIFGSTPNVFRDLYDDSNPDDRVGHPNGDGYDLMAQLLFDMIQGVDNVPPVTGRLSPNNGATQVSPNGTVSVELWDFGEGLNIDSTQLLINGSVVAPVQTGNSLRTTLTYTPPSPLAGVVDLGLRSADFASPANRTDRVIATFSVRGTQFLSGDLDQDGRVDGADLVVFGRAFGSSRGGGRYLGRADLNDDRTIDGDDLAILASNFGESSL